jgi:hypothetical protein
MTPGSDSGRARLAPLLAVTALLALAACGESQRDAAAGAAGPVHIDAMSFDGSTVVIRGNGAKARIAADGSLEIDGRPVPVDATQRASLARYHATALAIREHGIATAKAGVELAKGIAGDVIDGLAKGDTKGIDAKAEAHAEGVKQAAGRICEDLAGLREQQQSLVATLPAFAPFAWVESAKVEECRHDLAKRDAAPAPPAPEAPAAPGAPAAPAPVAPEAPAR